MKRFTVALAFALVIGLGYTTTFAQDSPPLLSQPQSLSGQPLSGQVAPAQVTDNSEYLFGPTLKTSVALVPTLKISPFREALGTMVGGHGGVVLDDQLLIGLGTYAMLNHPSVNIGYSGFMVEYRHTPNKLIHFGGSVLAGYGGAYSSSSGLHLFGLFENIGRLFSANFAVIEPSAFAELNLSKNLSASLGVSYRLIAGYNGRALDLTNENLSGVSVNLGLRFHDLF
jgi:hypothetical protein